MAEKIKRAQAAIWIILGVFLLGAILLFLLLRGNQENSFVSSDGGEFSFDTYLSACLAKEVNRATDIMFEQGGFIEPKSFKLYNKTNIEYLCFTSSYFEPCINQHPLLIDEMEEEIRNYISLGVDACFESLKEFIENRGGKLEISDARSEIGVELEYDKVIVNTGKSAILDYKDEVKNYENLEFAVRNPAYNFGIVAIEIADQESRYCYFETAGYTLGQHRHFVRRMIASDQTKIYTIQDKTVKKQMNIAIRSCALPEGMPG